MTCREFAKAHNISIVGKLKRTKLKNHLMNCWMKCFTDEDGNEFWVFHSGEIVYIDKDGGCI